MIQTLKAWNKLPLGEVSIPGYLLRETREKSGLTQMEIALRLGTTQQAVAQAERWDSNPTVEFIRNWAEACSQSITFSFGPG